MSIIIKGIDMPKASNDDMIVIIRHDENAEVWQSGKKETEAQAIQIPTPHGRLIDADLLKDTVRDSVPTYTIGVKIPTFGDTQIMSAIDVMPTILEPEADE